MPKESTETTRGKIARGYRKHSDIRFQPDAAAKVAFASRDRSQVSMSLPRFVPGACRVLPALALASAVAAQPPSPPPSAPPKSARVAARADLTGNWVAQVTEDWRWRMITPPKGDYASVPLNAEGRKVADGWDLARDNQTGEQCRAFGAGGIMRQPTRLRITWADDDTLRVETDAGQQTRLFHFDKGHASATERTWQGDSIAEWLAVAPPGNPFGFGGAPPDGGGFGRAAGPGPGSGPPPAPQHAGVKVVTTNLRAGYLRKNGVPYSEAAVVTEYYDRLSMFGNDYLQVVTVVVDPKYLLGPFAVSNQFKREPDGSKWRPTPCATDPPVGTLQRSAFVP
jgi:hypothetical protein